jgi:hypothetical protein
MTSVSVPQAAATLAATIVGLEAGLYGEDVVNAVMVVVAVSLILTSIGTTPFAPRIRPPREEHRRVAEAVLLSAYGDEDAFVRGVSRAAIQSKSSMLLLQWSRSENPRSRLLVAATAVPIAIAALHGLPRVTQSRVLHFARDVDFVPGNLPSLHLGADIASMLVRRHDWLIVGPLAPEAITGAGIPLPEQTVHRGEPDDIRTFATEHSEPGDIVILPTRDAEMSSLAIELYDSGRSVLAVTRNPVSQPSLSSSTIALPVGGTM